MVSQALHQSKYKVSSQSELMKFLALLVSSITEMLVITWVYGIENFCLDIRLMLKRDVHTYWKICWQYVSPALLSFVLVATMASWKRSSLDGVVFPAWTNAIALVLIFSSILFIPGMAIHHIVKKGGIKVRFKIIFHDLEDFLTRLRKVKAVG